MTDTEIIDWAWVTLFMFLQVGMMVHLLSIPTVLRPTYGTVSRKVV